MIETKLFFKVFKFFKKDFKSSFKKNSKNFLKKLGAPCGLLLLLCSTTSLAADLNTIKKVITNNMRSTKITSIKRTPIDGLYQVIAGRNVFYSDAKGRYLVFGHIYDLRTQADLTGAVQRSLLPKPYIGWKQLPKDAIVAGRSNIKLAIVLDPICPYCRALENELMPLTVIKDISSGKSNGKLSSKKSSLEIHYYLMPLGVIHPNAPYLSSQIWCSNNRLAALQKVILGKEISIKPTCDLTILNSMQKFFKKNHFDYTPILIREDGAMKFGYASKDKVLAWLYEYHSKNHRNNKNDNEYKTGRQL